jgi:hypothetical protein
MSCGNEAHQGRDLLKLSDLLQFSHNPFRQRPEFIAQAVQKQIRRRRKDPLHIPPWAASLG